MSVYPWMLDLLTLRIAQLPPLRKYGVIYADPPWKFSNWGGDTQIRNGVAASHYNVMDTDALCAMPVGKLAADDCALFMWATWPTLPDALRVGTAWGFEYKTLAFDWLKITGNGTFRMGLGNWTRANSEPCLLFTRGTPKRKSKRVRQVIAEVGQLELFPPIVEPLTVHSAKPFEAYRRIEALLDGPYLELFARVQYPGWDVWGNEAPKSISWEPFGGELATPVEATREEAHA